MVERLPRGSHGRRTRDLPEDNQEKTDRDGEAVREPLLPGREEDVRSHDFQHGAGVGEVIGRAVAEEEEGARSRYQGVVGGGRPELEEVEDCQCRAEGEEAPECVAGLGDGNGEHEAASTGGAEQEGL